MSYLSSPDARFVPDESDLRLQGLQVLLVDPHPDSLYLGMVVLESYGINVTPVMSAEQALHCLQQFRPHLLITELLLPEKDGCFLAETLYSLADDDRAPIPAIALTTQVSPRDRQRTFAAGFCKHLAKPYLFEELIGAIADLVPTPPATA